MYEYAIKKTVQDVNGATSTILDDVVYSSYRNADDAAFKYSETGRGYDGYTVSGLADAKRLVAQLELAARTTYDVVRRPLPVDWEECYE